MARYYRRRYKRRYKPNTRTMRRYVRRATRKFARRRRTLPRVWPNTHTAVITWTGAWEVNLPPLSVGTSYPFSLNNPWDPDGGNYTSGGGNTASGMSDLLKVWNECTVIGSKVRIEQEVRATSNLANPVFVYARKRIGNNASTNYTLPSTDEMFREIPRSAIRSWGELDGAWGNDHKSLTRPIIMTYSPKKDAKTDPWDPDHTCNFGAPPYQAFCHVNFQSHDSAVADPGPVKARIWIDFIVQCKGKKNIISDT